MSINLEYHKYLRTEVIKGVVTVFEEMSVYQFGTKVLGIQGPQTYSMVKNGTLPPEMIVMRNVVSKDGKTERQPFVKVPEAIKFFQARELAITSKAVKRIENNPEMFVEAVILMVEADNKKVGKVIRKWWTDKNAQATEKK